MDNSRGSTAEFTGPGETVETFFRQRMASRFASNLLPLHENQEENIHKIKHMIS